jgi:integrase
MVEEHFREAFGKVRSDRFTLERVEEWRAGVAEQIKAGTMSPKFYVNLRNLLHAIARWACHPRRRYLAQNPVDGLDKLHLPKTKKRPHFEPAQVADLLAAAAETPPDDTIIRLAVYSGLRRGELFALKWSDIDEGEAGGRIHVRRSIYQGAITAPKTEGSERVVDIPRGLLDDLAVYKLMHPAIGEGYVFRNAQGRPLDPDTWHRERLVPLLEHAGLRLPKTGLHSLRHTYVSLLAAQGEELRYIADQVGHSSTALTQQIYTHVFDKVRVAAMRRLDGAIPCSERVARLTGTTPEQHE